jgi:predicted Zn-dependent protease
LLVTVMSFVVVAILLISFATQLLVPFIPFSAEQKMADMFAGEMKSEHVQPEDAPLTQYLQSLADRLSKAEGLPADMTITAHFINDDTVNAFATLGGHVFIFRGLLESIPNENALAMVMAHEIAHVKYRHPIKSLGRGVVTGTAIAIVSTAAGGDIVGDVLGKTGLLTTLKFSRDQEQHADEEALASLFQLYGHVAGANTVFEVLKQAHKNDPNPPEFFSSHPHTDNRIDNLAAVAAEHEWPTKGKITPLPPQFKGWIKQAAAKSQDKKKSKAQVAH